MSAYTKTTIALAIALISNSVGVVLLLTGSRATSMYFTFGSLAVSVPYLIYAQLWRPKLKLMPATIEHVDGGLKMQTNEPLCLGPGDSAKYLTNGETAYVEINRAGLLKRWSVQLWASLRGQHGPDLQVQTDIKEVKAHE